jgi:hypothetical protein
MLTVVPNDVKCTYVVYDFDRSLGPYLDLRELIVASDEPDPTTD